ncbi:hypothetical protein DCAR_0417167 [Daucus carota subsp. sativus]|uniref:Uncharacterized protein n=1 Tax=Daucus carota subsp. sativus TaxID=79200 RepID=A0AAF0WZH1_DAUCS|nr:hypothetical protein DCAR_0417167 [Daucus carota subsp. sativus]
MTTLNTDSKRSSYSASMKNLYMRTILIHGLTSQQGWVFVFSLVGIIPMAERLGWATE